MDYITVLKQYGWGGIACYFAIKELIALWKKLNGDYISYSMLGKKFDELDNSFSEFLKTYERHVEDDGNMRLSMEKFFASQDQLNEHFKKLIDRDNNDIQKIFEMIMDIKNILIEKK